MNWYQKIFGFLNKKGVDADDDEVSQYGFLKKLTGAPMSRGEYLAQYKKSLYVFACISKIAQKTASIEFKMYQILNLRGDTKEIITHPALDLLYRVNPYQTKTEFLEKTMINLKTTGDAFWYKVRNKGGKVVELWNLRPDWMTIVADDVKFIKKYVFRKSDGSEIDFEPEEIVHFQYPNPLSDYFGMSPLVPAQARVQTEEFASRYQRDFFLNSARPDGVIKNKNAQLTKEQKEDIRVGWRKKYQGIGNNSKVAILTGDMDYQQISISQREMDFIESQKFNRDDILVAFQVPKPILSIVDDVNRANAETALYIFLSETIKPEMQRLVEKINEEMIYPDFGDNYFIDFVDPTPANHELEIKEYESGLQNNYMVINEVRQKLGLPPLNGGWSFYLPITSIPAGGLPQQKKKSVEGYHVFEQDPIKLQPEKKQFDFKGRFWLKQKFEIKETLEDSAKKVAKGIKGKIKKKENKSGKKEFKPLIATTELKQAWHGIINKKIDAKAKTLRDASDKFFLDQQDRVIGNLEKKVKGKKTKLSAKDILNIEKEIPLSINFITPYLESFLIESGQEALATVAPQNDFQDSKKIQKRIQKRAEQFAEEVNNTTLEKLDATLAEGIAGGEGIVALRNRVEDVYTEFPIYRSELIARTEATVANNEGMVEGFRQSGVATGKEWINSGDSRVRDEHQNGIGVGGEIVELDADFSNGLPYPSEPNCRCVVGPAFIE